jgi:hypothetical protein
MLKRKFTLRTLVVLVTLSAIGFGIHSWWEREKKRRTIPVRICGELEGLDNTPPAQVKFTPRRYAIASLKSAISSNTPAPTAYESAIAVKQQGTTVAAIVEKPSTFAYYLTRKDLVAALGDDKAVNTLTERLVQMLDDESVGSEVRFQYACILTTIGDRRGFDWGFARMRNTDAWDKPNTPNDKIRILQYANRNTNWLDQIDVWDLLQPRLDPSCPNTASDLANDLYPRKMESWLIKQARRADTSIDATQECFRKLSYFAPSVEALEACSKLFVKPGGPEYQWSHVRRYADELNRFGRGGEINSYSHLGSKIRKWYEENKPMPAKLKQIRAKVCEIATNFVGHNHWISREYHPVICEFGDENYREYFQKSLEYSNTRRDAFIALARLEGENRKQFLLKHAAGFEGQSKYLQDQAQSMLCAELAGSNDHQLTELLTKLFKNSEMNSDALIRRLFLLGSDEIAKELLASFREANPQSSPDVAELLVELQSRGFAEGLTIDGIDKEIMPEKPYEHLPHRLLIKPEQQVRVAFEKAELRTPVDMLIDVEGQLAAFSKISRGEFQVDLVHVDNAAKMVFFQLGDRVYRYQVKYPGEYQSPLVIAAIANAILSRLESPNRFIPYGNFEGNSEIYLLFGPRDLGDLLEKFGVEFHPGWQGYFEAPT